jgi:hypothetical protein
MHGHLLGSKTSFWWANRVINPLPSRSADHYTVNRLDRNIRKGLRAVQKINPAPKGLL